MLKRVRRAALSPYETLPIRRNVPIHRCTRSPFPNKKHRVAFLAGKGIDEELLGRVAEYAYREVTGDFCVVLFPREQFENYLEEENPNEMDMLQRSFDTSFPLPQLPVEEARKFTLIEVLFLVENELFYFERQPPPPSL